MTMAQRKLWSCSQIGNDSQKCGDQQSQTVSDVQQIQAHARLKKTTTLPKQSGRVPRTQLQGEQFKQLPMRAQDTGNWNMLVSKKHTRGSFDVYFLLSVFPLCLPCPLLEFPVFSASFGFWTLFCLFLDLFMWIWPLLCYICIRGPLMILILLKNVKEYQRNILKLHY